MANNMTEDDKADLREIWTLFSEMSCRARQVADDTISTVELPTILRALGQNPSDTDMQTLYQQADPMGTGSIQYNTFLSMAGGLVTNREQEIVEAFRVFDRDGKGTLNCAELRHVMCNLGEKFDDLEVDEMLREAGSTGDQIRYEDFTKKMCAQ